MADEKIMKGSYVDVKPSSIPGKRPSEGGAGIVVNKKHICSSSVGDVILTQDSSAESLYDVRYLIDPRLLQDVERERVSTLHLGTTACRRSDSDNVRPSILSPFHDPNVQLLSSPTVKSRPKPLTKYSLAWLLANPYKIIPSLKHKNDNGPAGWLRELEAKLDPPKDVGTGCYLTNSEREKCMTLLAAARPHDQALKYVFHAFGISRTAVWKMEKARLQTPDLSSARKVRSDKGKNLITSHSKRVSVYTGKHVFAKEYRKKHSDGKVTSDDINAAWSALSDQEQLRYDSISQKWIEQQGPFLLSELTKALSK